MRINVWVSAKILIHRYHGTCPLSVQPIGRKKRGQGEIG